MTEKKSPLDQALDLLVYAPLGLALTARDELPKLIDRGRTQVQAQAGMARAVGQFAVAQGQKEAEKLVRRVTGESDGHVPRPAASSRPQAAGAAEPGTRRRPAPAAGASTPSSNGAPLPAVDTLAIPGYDALAASQVVPRLAGLAPEELEAVRRYEAGTRTRRTILARIQQLQSADRAD